MSQAGQKSGADPAHIYRTPDGQNDEDFAQAFLNGAAPATAAFNLHRQCISQAPHLRLLRQGKHQFLGQGTHKRVGNAAKIDLGRDEDGECLVAGKASQNPDNDVRGAVAVISPDQEKICLRIRRIGHNRTQAKCLQECSQPVMLSCRNRTFDHAILNLDDRDYAKLTSLQSRSRSAPDWNSMSVDAAAKFDPSRAAEYETQSRIALAGYDACHELAACMLAASLGTGSNARILVAGAGGTAREVITAARLEPSWSFVAVDPSKPMLDLATSRIGAAGLMERTEPVLGVVSDLPKDRPFDAATLIGVLHHLPGHEAKQAILGDIAARVNTGAPLILAGNHHAYASQPLMMAAWAQRWRMNGATPAEIETKLGKILQGADPPQSEDAVLALLSAAGFTKPLRFFSSLFWGAWIAFRK